MGIFDIEEQREQAVELVRQRLRERSRERYEAKSEAIRQGAETEPIYREDEFPMSWGRGDHSPVLQVPLPRFIPAPSGIPPGITHALDPDFQRRNVYWQAFAAKSAEVGVSHAATSLAVRTYFDAAHDPDLGALQYSIGATEKIDVGKATNREVVPNRQPRASVGSLFDAKNQLAIDYSTDGFMGVQNSVESGKSDAKTAEAETQRADEKLVTMMSELRRRVKQMQAAALGVQSAAAQLRSLTVGQDRRSAERELDDVQARADAAGEAVETVFNLVAMLVHIGEGGIGDAVEKVGEFAAKAVSHAYDDAIETAKNKVEQLRFAEVSNSRDALLATLGASGLRLHEAVTAVEEQRGVLRSALGARRTAYNNLGQAAAKAVPSAPGKHKVAASLAAIPLVDAVIAKAHDLRASANVPAPEAAAERGLRIAHDNGHPSGKSFLVACDQLNAARQRGAADERKWIARRDQLFAVKEAMFGRRPSPED